jgi:hypothetical protein
MPPITVPLAGAACIGLLIEHIYAITTANTIHRDLARAARQDSVFAAQLIQSHKAVGEQYQKSQREIPRLDAEIYKARTLWEGTDWCDILREVLDEVEQSEWELGKELIGLQRDIHAKIKEEGLE